jgi:hypothetical protein
MVTKTGINRSKNRIKQEINLTDPLAPVFFVEPLEVYISGGFYRLGGILWRKDWLVWRMPVNCFISVGKRCIGNYREESWSGGIKVMVNEGDLVPM